MKTGILLLALLLPAAGVLAEVRAGDLIRFEVLDALSGERLYEGVEQVAVDSGNVSKRTVYRARGVRWSRPWTSTTTPTAGR